MSSRVLRLPARGRLLVSSDLQGNLGDFRALERHFRAAPEGTVLVITGDLVHGPDEDTLRDWPAALGTPYRDESFALVEAFLELQAEFPGQVHCLMGNHDHAHVGGPVTAKFHEDEAAALEATLDATQVAQLKEAIRQFPLVAVAPCGVALVHAAPSADLSGPEDLEQVAIEGYRELSFVDFLDVPVMGPLLWSRMATDAEAERFVMALGAEVAVFGHDIVREGWAKDGPRQLCLSTSFGLFDEHKTYLELDLAGHYASTDDFHVGQELKPLYPAPSCY